MNEIIIVFLVLAIPLLSGLWFLKRVSKRYHINEEIYEESDDNETS